MPTLALGDRRVSYEDYGSGPVALLIHGRPEVAGPGRGSVNVLLAGIA
jgi:hypothetical protein